MEKRSENIGLKDRTKRSDKKSDNKIKEKLDKKVGQKDRTKKSDKKLDKTSEKII